MLALPADSRGGGQRFLHHRRGIDKNLQRPVRLGGDPAAKPFQALLDHIMVIAPAGVNRDIGLGLLPQKRQRVFRRAIIHAQHDDASRPLPESVRRTAFSGAHRQPVHVALPAKGEEFLEVIDGYLFGTGRGESDFFEAQRLGLSPDRRFDVCQKSSFS